MRAINTFLLGIGESISRNPCVSPDFCLNWERVGGKLAEGLDEGFVLYPKSEFRTAAGSWSLVEDKETGDCAWNLRSPFGGSDALDQGIESKSDGFFFPATWANLLKIKNLVQEHDSGSTIFPSAGADLGRSTLGIGARFTTLHWPAVEWAMSALGIGLTANQNSIPRELVYDVDAMLEHRLDKVPFPFIGASVPEGHQGQSVEGMSHGCVLSKLKTGFHRRRIAWSFNADHQPIGGAYDEREDALVRGCLLASYITFDLSPELSAKRPARASEVDRAIESKVRSRVKGAGIMLADGPFEELMRAVWPAMQKMQRRDAKYKAARNAAFTTPQGRAYLRELSIDELPGLTMPETTAVMLALCETLGMPVNFIAPAFGFLKNLPYPDDAKLRSLISKQWDVARKFGVSIGFHSGSGKSAKNYAVMGEVTGGCLEIKTSGRYTYEMGVALANSADPGDARLWAEWHDFTADLAAAGAFSSDETEKKMARLFISQSLEKWGSPTDAFSSQNACRAALGSLPRSPDHVFFFEYNFLYVLAAGGKTEKSALGDHSAAGYRQRARFYSISPSARLLFAKGVATYIIFLARWTGLCARERCDAAEKLLSGIESYERLVDTISK